MALLKRKKCVRHATKLRGSLETKSLVLLMEKRWIKDLIERGQARVSWNVCS